MKIFRNEYFLFLLPLFFILHRFTEHFASIAVEEALLLYGEYLLISIILCSIFFGLFHSGRKALLFTFWLMAFHFFFGSLHDGAKDLLGNSFLVKYVFILPFVLILFLLLGIYFKKTRSGFNRITRYLNFLLLVLILIDGFILFSRVRNSAPPPLKGLSICPDCPRPDIYLLVADGYPGKGQLMELYGFDNSAFEDSLRQLGFYIVDSSISNYGRTSRSMTSLLNMDYLEEEGWRKSHQALNRTRVVDYLEEQGYAIKNLSFFRINGHFPRRPFWVFKTGTKLITDHTFYGRMDRDIRHNLGSKLGLKSEVRRFDQALKNYLEYEKGRNGWVMNELPQEARKNPDEPRFTYAHFLMPHGPFYFNEDGSPMPDTFRYEQKVLAYLKYSNGKLLSTLKALKRNIQKPSVILFMSDHGARNPALEPDRLKFLTLNAVYFPGGDTRLFYKGQSNVNQFRILLNQLFRQKLPLLKDSTIQEEPEPGDDLNH